MKSILAAIIIFLIASTEADAQSIRADLNMSANPSMHLSDWSSRRETATLMIYNSSDKPVEVKIDAKLSLGGAVIAITKPGSMPTLTVPPGGPATYYAGDLFPENAVSFFGDLHQNTMRTGILPEGNYDLCIVLTNVQNQPLTNPICRSFNLQKNILPVLLQPENDKKIISGTQGATLFVWTPILPISTTPVNYRLRVVEMLPSQTAQQAFITNKPLFEKVTNGMTQLLWPQEIPLPDAGIKLAWGVQPEDELGNPLVQPERFTNAFDLVVLPTREQCETILAKVKKIRSTAIKIEEEYWAADWKMQRTSQLLEEAEERADALDIQTKRKAQEEAQKKLEKIKTAFDKSREKYDAAIIEYEDCGK
jgi:hypothetical protein